MAEATSSPTTSERHRSDDAPRGDRAPGPREGGFRIRLSDNEMRSARALQEAFGLRSTVAVLGFALRTLGQQLEEGKLDELVSQHKALAGAARGGGGRPEGRRERPEGRGAGGRWQESRGGGARAARIDPFARPSRPTPAPESVEATDESTELGEELASEPAVADLAGDAPLEATEASIAESAAPESSAIASSTVAELAADAPDPAAATLPTELPAPEPAEA